VKYRPDVDGLRAVAVLPVVFYHAGFPGPSGGFVGVDVFFVISGFLITSIVAGEINEGRFSLLSFYEKRARRILPALTVVVLASFIVGYFLLMPSEMKDLGQSAFATSIFLSNVYFDLKLNYFAPAAEFAPLLHTWSLAVEEQFYLFFPPLLMAVFFWRHVKPFWIVAGLSLVSFLAAIVVLPLAPDWVFYQLPFRAWELGAGAMLALASLKPPKNRLVRESLAVVGLTAILIPVFLLDTTVSFPGVNALPPVLGAAILIWIGAAGGGSSVSALLSHQVFVRIGLISYSLYLWHWPILAFLRIALDTTVLPLVVATLAVVASIIIAWLSYIFVETPFRVRASNGFGRPTIFAISALSLFAIAGIGASLHFGNGLPSRLPSSVIAMAAYADDGNPLREECFGRRPSEGLCEIGAPNGERELSEFLFWGDSHALAFMPGLDSAARLVGQTGVFAGQGACPPILHIERVSTGRACTDFNQSVVTWLEDRMDIPVVVLGARWTLSVEGTRYRGEAGSEVDLEWIGNPASRPSYFDNAALVEAGLNATVERLANAGRRVILLGPVPEIGRNVPFAAARQVMFDWRTPASLMREDYQARAGRTEQILMRVANLNEGVRYIPLSDLFCDTHSCRTLSADGQPLYRDDDHINQTAALSLLPSRLAEIWQEEY
jgi:peptidoglycan/LPS O-acetylase OafA/YrhL